MAEFDPIAQMVEQHTTLSGPGKGTVVFGRESSDLAWLVQMAKRGMSAPERVPSNQAIRQIVRDELEQHDARLIIALGRQLAH